MNPTFRLILDTPHEGAYNMALDEAILDSVTAQQSPPTLRFYQWKPAMLSIGYFQSMEEEVNRAACQTFQIDCVRRTTGGGAVLHEDEVTYSLIAPIGYANLPQAILASYQMICEGMILGVNSLGLPAEFAPLNDIVVNHQKISGNAQTRRHGVILQHGTLLLNVNIEKMFSLLKVPSEKLKDKLIHDVKKRVIGLNQLLPTKVSYETVVKAVLKGFQQRFLCHFQEGSASPDELIRTQHYRQEKYQNPAWNDKR